MTDVDLNTNLDCTAIGAADMIGNLESKPYIAQALREPWASEMAALARLPNLPRAFRDVQQSAGARLAPSPTFN